MSGIRPGRLLALVLLASSGCTACHKEVTLHGFFGDPVVDAPLVQKLIPPAREAAPFPPYWIPSVPLLSFTGIHRSLYLDALWDPDANDMLKDFGLESSTLAFYVGHGTVKFWTSPDDPPNNTIELDRVKAGDGLLRYFWLYSCNVMAHGPSRHDDFPFPHLFQKGDEDVFDRWRPAFGSGLRMVCGGSTRLGFAHVGEIWNHLFEEGRSVADAFVLGVAQPGQVPACLARGGRTPASSPLADRTLLTDEAGGDEPNWLHFQYSVDCKVEGDGFHVQCGAPPVPPNTPPLPLPKIASIPKLTTEAMQPPIQPEEGSRPLGFLPLPSKGPFIKDFKYNPASGAVVLIKKRNRYTLLKRCNEVTNWDLSSLDLLSTRDLSSMGFLPSVAPGANSTLKLSHRLTALEMRVESRQDGAEIKDRECWVHSLFLRVETQIHLGAQSLPIFGSTMTLEVPRSKDLELASFSAPRRELGVLENQDHSIKSAAKSLSEARKELHLDPETYPSRNEQATLGYEEAPLRCRQSFLRPTYEIRFVPANADHPTVIVRRDARADPKEPSWKCQSW